MVTKELVINTTSHETRVALLEGGHIAELYIEREREMGIVDEGRVRNEAGARLYLRDLACHHLAELLYPLADRHRAR